MGPRPGNNRSGRSCDVTREPTAVRAAERDMRARGRRARRRITLDFSRTRRTTQRITRPVARDQMQRLSGIVCRRAWLPHEPSNDVQHGCRQQTPASSVWKSNRLNAQDKA